MHGIEDVQGGSQSVMLPSVRVASWNIHGAVGMDRRQDLPRIAQVLREVDADVLLLQEVGCRRGDGPARDHAHELGAALGMEVAVGRTMGAYGNAVLVRGGIAATDRHDLSVAGREPRCALRVDAELAGGRRVRAVGTHFGLSRGERARQGERLLALTAGGDRVVIGGDFNDFARGPANRALAGRYTDAAVAARDGARTFPSRLPIVRLDRVYSGGGLNVERYRVHRSPLARLASDHLPVVVEYARAP
jgi:endonuclease/exonuclease/phosphatase family metal-dependent hydrolase